MSVRWLPLLLLLALPCAARSADSQPNIVGAWTCGPYETQGPELAISALDRRVYSDDGHYTQHDSATYTRADIKIHTEARHTGTWSLQGDVIEIRFTSSEFLSSDHPAVTVAKGQATLDAMRAHKNTDAKRILKVDGQSMTTMAVEPTDKQAAVEVSCVKG